MTETHDRQMLEGDFDVVEVDETHLYTNKYHRGRLLRRQIWSFGCLSRLTGDIHVELIIHQTSNKTRQILDDIIAQNVQQGSYVMSDMHRAYLGVHFQLNTGKHYTVNQRIQFVNGTVDIPVDYRFGRQSLAQI